MPFHQSFFCFLGLAQYFSALVSRQRETIIQDLLFACHDSQPFNRCRETFTHAGISTSWHLDRRSSADPYYKHDTAVNHSYFLILTVIINLYHVFLILAVLYVINLSLFNLQFTL